MNTAVGRGGEQERLCENDGNNGKHLSHAQ